MQMKKICSYAFVSGLKLQVFYRLKPVHSIAQRKQRCLCKATVYLNGLLRTGLITDYHLGCSHFK